MTHPRLAVCIVATDDARDLHGCLQSVRQLGPLLSRVVVYGVGASDAVLDAARTSGALVEVGEDDGDAAAARNAAACATDADWVLVMEPHDRLRVDVTKLERLLDVPENMIGEPDALSVQVSRGSGPGSDPQRLRRLYRPDRAHFVGALDAHLEALEGDRPLVALTPGADVVSLWSVVEEQELLDARAKLRRREARATAALASFKERGIAGNDLVTALVERSRARRALGDDNGALEDLNRARRVRASDTYRWRARQDLTTLLIEHRYYAGADKLIDELRRDGADEDYSDWLTAQVQAAQGQAAGAFDILRRLTEVRSADGHLVGSVEILNDTMVMANRLGMFDEALACCVDLVARHGHAERYARMLLKLWGPRSAEGLADLLIQADGRHLDDVARVLDSLPGLGPAVAARVREVRAEKPAAVRIM